jgi:hypothetical protein
MITTFFKTLPIFATGLYVGLRCGHWLGDDTEQQLTQWFIGLEDILYNSYKWIEDWVLSLWDSSTES